MVKPGDIVLYKLSALDVEHIHEQHSKLDFTANGVYEGEVLPLVVVKVWPHEFGPDVPGVNGQVLLDGPDSLWVTSVGPGGSPGKWFVREGA